MLELLEIKSLYSKYTARKNCVKVCWSQFQLPTISRWHVIELESDGRTLNLLNCNELKKSHFELIVKVTLLVLFESLKHCKST